MVILLAVVINHSKESCGAALKSSIPKRPVSIVGGRGNQHPALRRVEARWIRQSAACDSPSPGGEGGVRGKERSANQRAGELPMNSTTLSEGKQSPTPAKAPRP